MRKARRTAALVALWLVVGCGQELALPDEPVRPDDPVLPSITDFAPHATYPQEFIEIDGEGFDPDPANNTVLFYGGYVATAEPIGSSTTHLRVMVPYNAYSGALQVRTPGGTSAPSEKDYVSLGFGHPVLGTPVADLRFRHRPVGLVNTTWRILAASTLFDAVLDDFGTFLWLQGRPVTLRRIPGQRALVSTEAPDGGRLVVVDVADGTRQASSLAFPRTEQFLLPSPTGASTLARSIGTDSRGRAYLTRWLLLGDAISAFGPSVLLDVDEVLGAAISGETVVVCANKFIDGVPRTIVARLADDGTLTRLQVDPERTPVGPLAIVQRPSGPAAIAALSDGDLHTIPLDGSAPSSTRLTSYATARDVQASEVPGHVLVTKPRDAALYDYDMSGEGAFAWSVQLTGEPTVIDVSAELHEIAVGNDATNAIDVIHDDGQWRGRSSLSLRLGSADGGAGGVVAPYTYDTAFYPPNTDIPDRILILSRAAPMAIQIDAGELGMSAQWRLDPSLSPVVRLAVNPGLEALSVRENEIGLLVPRPADDPEAFDERVLVSGLSGVPVGIDFLRDGRTLVASKAAVDVYTRRTNTTEGTDALVKTGHLAIPASCVVRGLVSHRSRRPGTNELGDEGKDAVLVVWRGPDGPGGALFDPANIGEGESTGTPIHLPPGANHLTGVLDLVSGPAAAYAAALASDGTPYGPALLAWPYLRGDAAATLLPALATGPQLLATTPDQWYVPWASKAEGENVLRVLMFSPEKGLVPDTSYRLAAQPSGAGLDPSGEWLYIPLPELDQVTVVQ